jgi:branched-chain amino acid transport system substrate-binding protein
LALPLTEPKVQGQKTCQVLLLLLACLWLVGCGSFSAPTPAPITVEVPVEVPVEVTRVVTQQVMQQVIATPTPVAPCAAHTPGESAVVTVGAILPLSSPGAILAGYAMQTALNIAVTEINEQGGILDVPLRLVTYDSAGTPERAALFAERLILLDCAVGIVGLYHNADAMAVTDVAHRFGIPVIVAEAGADDITARGYPEVFRLAPAYSMLAEMPAQWLSAVGDYNTDGTLSATIIAENSNSASTLIDAIGDNLVEAGIAAELLKVDLPSTDFSSAIARLVAHDQLPDAIFISIKGEPALLLQSQLLEAGIGPQRSTLIVQNHAGLNSAQFWAEVPNGNGTVVRRMGAWSSTLTERGHEFAIKYDQYMGHWPESYAFASYDSLWLLANALDSAPSWKGSDLVATLEEGAAALTSGLISFTLPTTGTTAAIQPPYLWHQWLDSQVLYLQYTEVNQPADAMSVVWPPRFRAPSLQTAIIPITP